MSVIPRFFTPLVFVLLVASCEASRGGWFSDTNFYVVEQKTPSGKFIEGWVVQGPPKNDNGVYIFTIHQTTIEKRIPVQGTVVTKIGPNLEMAHKFLSREIATLSDEIPKGF